MFGKHRPFWDGLIIGFKLYEKVEIELRLVRPVDLAWVKQRRKQNLTRKWL